MEEQTEVDWSMDFRTLFFSQFSMLDFVALMSGFVVIAIFFNLAFNSSKLYKSTNYPGTKTLKYSCWFLALMWVPLYLLTYFFEDVDLYLNLFTVITTVPMITAAWGFRTYVGAVSRKD